MNNEIINKIKSRMAGELLPEQLNKLVCDSKNQSCLQLFRQCTIKFAIWGRKKPLKIPKCW